MRWVKHQEKAILDHNYAWVSSPTYHHHHVSTTQGLGPQGGKGDEWDALMVTYIAFHDNQYCTCSVKWLWYSLVSKAQWWLMTILQFNWTSSLNPHYHSYNTMSSNIGIIKYIIINQSLFEYETMKSGGVVTNSMTDCPLSHLRTPERNLFGVHHLVSAALANRSMTSELATSPTWVGSMPWVPCCPPLLGRTSSSTISGGSSPLAVGLVAASLGCSPVTLLSHPHRLTP